MLTTHEMLKELPELEVKHEENPPVSDGDSLKGKEESNPPVSDGDSPESTASPSSARNSGDSPPNEENDVDSAPARPKTSRAIPYWLNDLYLAAHIYKMYGDDVCYCKKLGGYLIWNGARWAPDEDFTLWRRALNATNDIWRTACELPPRAAKRRFYTQKWAKRAEQRGHIEGALRHLRAFKSVLAEPAVFDPDPWLFNAQNGTVDLRTGELGPHLRENMITRFSPVPYEPDCPPPERWLQFLSEIFDGNRDIIEYLQRACGYALTGSVDEQKLFFLYGTGANGKTTFLETLLYVMGDHARRLSPHLLFSVRSDRLPAALARLRACRLAVSTEIECGIKLAEARVKELTGGDRLVAKRRWRDAFEFEPTHKLFICGNHLPVIRGTDHAMWRRIDLIPFNVTIPEQQRDRGLLKKLRAEATGILDWLVTGCLEWQKQGLAEPIEVLAATNGYRTDMDILGDFLNDRCVIAPDRDVTSADLNRAYRAWCEKNCERPMSSTALGMRFRERGFRSVHMGKSRTRTWVGAGLRDA